MLLWWPVDNGVEPNCTGWNGSHKAGSQRRVEGKGTHANHPTNFFALVREAL